MTDQYKLIDDLHEELETVHEGLGPVRWNRT